MVPCVLCGRLRLPSIPAGETGPWGSVPPHMKHAFFYSIQFCLGAPRPFLIYRGLLHPHPAVPMCKGVQWESSDGSSELALCSPQFTEHWRVNLVVSLLSPGSPPAQHTAQSPSSWAYIYFFQQQPSLRPDQTPPCSHLAPLALQLKLVIIQAPVIDTK